MARITITDVARRSGMSISTVSQALNGTGRISKPTKLLVRKAADELGYIPDSRARSMRSSRSRAVGLLVPDIRNAYFSELVYAVQDQLYRKGYAPLIGVSSCEESRAEDFYRILLSRHMDGVIVVPDGPTSPMLTTLLASDFPVVFVDRPETSAPDAPLVDSDPTLGLVGALNTLVAKGFDRVVFVPGPEERSATFREREQAFLDQAAIHPSLQGRVATDGFGSQDQARTTMLSLVDQGVQAFIFGYSGDAIRAIAVGNEIRADHEDICLISFDDLKLFRLVTPQVSVISQQVDAMGRLSVDILLSIIDGGSGSDRSQDGPAIRNLRTRTETRFIPRGVLA